MRPALAIATITLLLTVSLAGCTSPTPNHDQDGDGLPDALERDGWTITITLADGTKTTRHVSSDPTTADTDGDGVLDIDERVRGTDPRHVDTDGDGLLDGRNIALDPASDRAAELRELGILESPAGHFLGEMDLCTDAGGLKPNEASSDRPFADRLGDGEELRGWLIVIRGHARAVASSPCVPDTDRDGLPDDLEKELGTDPTTADTDGDGVPDGQDADPLWDLGIAIESLSVTTQSGNDVRLTLHAAGRSRSITLAEGAIHATAIHVNDTSPTRASLEAIVLLRAEDALTETPVDLFPTGSETVLTFDVIRGTLADTRGPIPDAKVRFQGRDGGLTFRWSTTRS